ncbi:MAG: DMT family transporter [Bacteroidota bacterium]
MHDPRPPSRSPDWISDAGLLFVVLVWGLNFAIIKVPLDVMDPFTVNLFRFAVALVTLGLLHGRASRRRGERFTEALERSPGAVIGLGLLAHVVYQTGFILGIDRITAGMGALLMATAPLWTAIIGHIGGVDRLAGRAWLGVGLGLAGAILVVVGRPAGAEMSGAWTGIALVLAGALAWAVFTVLARPVLTRGVSPLGLTFWGLLFAFPVLVALGVPGLVTTEWARAGSLVWAALVFSGALSIAAAYAIWNEAVRRIGPSRTALYSNLVPFAGVGAGAVLLGEAVVPLQIAGGVLVVAGLVVVRRS